MVTASAEQVPNTIRAISAFKKHVPAGVERATCRYISPSSKDSVEVVLWYPDGSIQSGVVYLMDKRAYMLSIHTTYSPKDGWSHPHHRHNGKM